MEIERILFVYDGELYEVYKEPHGSQHCEMKRIGICKGCGGGGFSKWCYDGATLIDAESGWSTMEVT